MQKIKVLLLIIFFGAVSTTLIAQNELSQLPFGKRLVFGGGLGLQFGDVTAYQVSPTVGYRATEKLTVGLNFQYQSITYKYSKFGGTDETYNSFGYGPFANYFINENLFVLVEGLILEADYVDFRTLRVGHGTIPHFFVGGGYAQRFGNGSYFSIGIKYDLIQDPRSPYLGQLVYSPTVAFGF